MTFEEFFIKKKIDLDQLKLGEPVLFEEFHFEYSQMGEKSFDHTKKFWFNKLRKIYHLKPDQKPELKKPQINALASQAVPLTSPTIDEKPTYSPRFKPSLVSQQTTETATNADVALELKTGETAPENPKPAYKPRFKAASVNKESEELKTSETAPESPKPAYKPRFKATSIIKEPEQIPEPDAIEEEKTQESSVIPDPKVKPAYKPRFKPGMMNKPKPKDEGESTS